MIEKPCGLWFHEIYGFSIWLNLVSQWIHYSIRFGHMDKSCLTMHPFFHEIYGFSIWPNIASQWIPYSIRFGHMAKSEFKTVSLCHGFRNLVISLWYCLKFKLLVKKVLVYTCRMRFI